MANSISTSGNITSTATTDLSSNIYIPISDSITTDTTSLLSNTITLNNSNNNLNTVNTVLTNWSNIVSTMTTNSNYNIVYTPYIWKTFTENLLEESILHELEKGKPEVYKSLEAKINRRIAIYKSLHEEARVLSSDVTFYDEDDIEVILGEIKEENYKEQVVREFVSKNICSEEFLVKYILFLDKELILRNHQQKIINGEYPALLLALQAI